MPIYKLIKRYPKCPEEWIEGMLFTKDQHKRLYRPLNKINPDSYVECSFVEEDNSIYWKKHETTNEDIFDQGTDLIIMPKKFKKEFAEVINRGLRNARVSDELKKFLQQYSYTNLDKNFPGSIKL